MIFQHKLIAILTCVLFGLCVTDAAVIPSSRTNTQECGTGEEGSLYLALNLDGTDGMITKGQTLMNLEPEFRPSVDQKFEIGCIDGGPVTVGGKLVVNSFMHVNGHQLVATDDFDSAELCTGTHSGVMWDQTCILNFTLTMVDHVMKPATQVHVTLIVNPEGEECGEEAYHSQFATKRFTNTLLDKDDVIVDLNVDIKPSFNEDFKLEVECIDSFNENGSRSKVRAMTTMRGNRLVAAKKLDLVELCPDNGNTFEDTCSVKLTFISKTYDDMPVKRLYVMVEVSSEKKWERCGEVVGNTQFATMQVNNIFQQGDVILDMNAVFSQTIVSDNFQLDCINGQEVSGDRVTTTMFETSGHHLVAGEDFELDMFCDKDASDCRVQLALTSMGAGVTKERLYVKLVKLPNAAPDGEEAVEPSSRPEVNFSPWAKPPSMAEETRLLMKFYRENGKYTDNFRKYHCAVRNVYRMRTEGALAPFVTLNVTCDHSPRRRDPEVFRAVRCLTKECQHLDQSCVGDETPGRFTVVPSYERKFIDKPVRYMPTNPKLNFIRHWVDIPVGCSCVWRPN